MPVDTSIYNRAQYADPFDSFMDGYQGARKNKLLDLQMTAEQAKLAEAQRKAQFDASRRNALMDALNPETGDFDEARAIPGLARIGDFDGIQSIKKSQAEAAKMKREQEAATRKEKREQFTTIGQILGSAKDQPTYDAALRRLSSLGYDVSQESATYDPVLVQQALKMTLDASQQLEQEWKQKEWGVKEEDRKAPKIEYKDDGSKLIPFQMNPLLPGYGLPVQGNAPIVKQQSPDSRASTAVSWANHNLAVKRENREANTPKGSVMQTDQGAFIVDPRNPSNPVPVTFNGQPLKSSGSVTASEDERKAAGWFAQADLAWKNMQKVMRTDDGKLNSSVTQPGVLENTASWLGWEQAANAQRSEKRQQFVQAASALAEPLLRAATGAGMTEAEARQKIMELTPQLTDKGPVIQQKLDAIPVFLESLKSRGGRAIPSGSGGVVDFNSLTK